MKTGDAGKRIIAFVLCLALLFSAAVQAYAGETAQDAASRGLENVEKAESADGTVLLIWFNRRYSQEGGDYSVTVELSGEGTYTVPQEELRRAVWDRGENGTSKMYPVLFVYLPSETVPDHLLVHVSAGVFRSSSGEESPAFCVESADFFYRSASAIGLRCKATVTGLEKLGCRVVPNTPLTVSSVYGELAQITYDGAPVEGGTIDDAGGAGTHILRAQVAPGYYEEIVLHVDSPAKAYLRSLGQHTVYALLSPFCFLLLPVPYFLAGLVTVPGFAPMIAFLPLQWSVTAVKEFFQSFAHIQGKEYEFRAG